jgi:CBS domain-containing protein
LETTVEEVFYDKEEWVLTVQLDTTAREAIEKMVEQQVGSVIVVEDEDPIGIFTERDFLRRVALSESVEESVPVREVMTPKVICVDPNYTLKDCMAIMTAERCRHLPVMRDGSLTGMVSIGDCAKKLSQNAEVKLKHLEDYIRGRYPR